MLLKDFVLDADTGIRLPRTEAPPAGYLDGAERFLREALPGVSDRSVGSAELQELVRDWPTLYHLTPYRATIFDCLGFERAGDARVLELGAGCGAITRWLGEHCGEVHAIEGDRARAEVARARTADLPGVHLYASNFSGLQEREAFEIVTLIGVLEYGHLYHPAHHGRPWEAAVANLRTARQALTADGALVLAIENKLGLKYFNGAREDHSGRLYDSIQGYPDRTVPVTFSAREMERLLAEAGFATSRFYIAHPDYKLATTLVDAGAAADDDYIHNWLDAPAPDRGAERGTPLFNERLAQREVARAGLALDLANSFLVVAYPEDGDTSAERLGLELDWVARHYSLGRRPCFQKRATLRGDTVLHERAPFSPGTGEEATEVQALVGLSQQLGPEPYARGDLVVHSVLETIAGRGGDAFGGHVARLREWLIGHYGITVEEGGPALVRGEAFDATWWNLVEDPGTGEWTVVDEEWRFDHPLPADYVVWRCLNHFLLRNRLQLPQPAAGQDAGAFADHWLRQAAGLVSAELLAEFAQLDMAIGRSIAPGPLPDAAALSDTLRALGATERRIVLADAAELAEDDALLTGYLDAFAFDDPVTLALLAEAGTSEALAHALQTGAAAERMEADGAADVMLAERPADAGGWERLVASATAVLSNQAPGGRLVGLPHFGDDGLAGLRELLAGDQPRRT